jgi:thiosulfate/3-mercaptopyruvate sulfurtransferase
VVTPAHDNPPLPDDGSNSQTDDVHPLIDVPSLTRVFRDTPPPVLLDVRWHLAGPPGIEAYRKGHLPGAVFVDLDRDLAGPPGPAGRHPLPAKDTFQEAMQRAGVTSDRLVVVYDNADSTAAARAWWTLRYFGHRQVRVLDGGYRAWIESGQPVTTATADPRPGDFTARPGRLPVLDADGAAALAGDGVLLDARAGERYRGEVEPVDPVAGHIPGAVSAPTVGNIGVDGRFLPADLLRERFAKLGATDAVDVGVYCGSGVTAAHEVLALTIAGVPAALYVGSWSNWVAAGTRPIAKD